MMSELIFLLPQKLRQTQQTDRATASEAKTTENPLRTTDDSASESDRHACHFTGNKINVTHITLFIVFCALNRRSQWRVISDGALMSR